MECMRRRYEGILCMPDIVPLQKPTFYVNSLNIETGAGGIDGFENTEIRTRLHEVSGGAVHFVSVPVASLASLHPDDSYVSVTCVAEGAQFSLNNVVRLQIAGNLG